MGGYLGQRRQRQRRRWRRRWRRRRRWRGCPSRWWWRRQRQRRWRRRRPGRHAIFEHFAHQLQHPPRAAAATATATAATAAAAVVWQPVAHRHHRCELGSVPAPVERADALRRRVHHHLHQPDGQPPLVARAAEEQREVRLLRARGAAAARAPLLTDDGALGIDVCVRALDVIRELAQQLERLPQQRRIVHRHVQLVHRLVEGGVGVLAAAEAHAHLLQRLEYGAARGGGAGGAERQVLDEVRQPALLLRLADRPHLQRDAQRGALLGLGVVAHVVRDAVAQRAVRDVAVQVAPHHVLGIGLFAAAASIDLLLLTTDKDTRATDKVFHIPV